MKKTFQLSLFLFCVSLFKISFAQSNYEIVYEQYENNKLIPNRTISLKCNNEKAAIANSSTTEHFFIDYKNKTTIKTALLSNTKFAVITSFDSLPKAVITNEKDTLLGMPCKKIKYDIFSNRIEVWVTDKAMCKGSPSISFVPQNELVLKYSINGSRVIIAKSMQLIQQNILFPNDSFKKITEPEYAAAQIKSRYSIIPIFEKEQINFEDLNKNKTIKHLETEHRFVKGNVVLKTIKLPDHASKGSYFIKLTLWSNGDAYDRVGSVFTISSQKEKSVFTAMTNGLENLPIYEDKNKQKYQGIISSKNYFPAIELMRFFTPFGVGHFNKKRMIAGYDWSDSVVYKQDVTSLIPSDEKEMMIGVYIGNYDKGGHKVSLELDFYPEAEMPETKKIIQPLFNTVNIMEAEGQNYGKLFQTDSLKVDFEVADSLDNLQLLFTTTGHGGWENGDEFNPKLNQLFIDGKEEFHITPWRTDCGTYRLLNPASGNFPDGLSSSDLSRSNWCPGTLTPPYFIPLKKLTQGKHTIQVVINQGKNEGESFSHWCISGVLVATKK
ncbi:MAG: hypothetical protein RJA07_1202 [Bacteroidota bacterium]|jgi:hypothetical protein